MHTRRAEHTWMKNHPLEGDDIVTGLYNFLVKRNPKTMKPCHDILVPDTVVFEHNFPRGWYTTDVKAREVMRKQGKELDASTIERGFVEGVPEACPIVATYLCTQEDDMGNGETRTRTLVEVFNKDTLAAFLARKTKKEGILQKFLLPKGYYNSVIQAVWSPRVCMVQRRTNKHAVHDKKRAEADPFASTVTYEGPTFLSEEGTVSGNIALEVKRLCGCVVQHFYYTEHKFITRMVLYFKMDRRNRLWLLWCGSLRVSDRTASSEMPVNLITNFAEPREGEHGSVDGFDEDALLYSADAAFVRATHDEMFYETYVKDEHPRSGSRGYDAVGGSPDAAVARRTGRRTTHEAASGAASGPHATAAAYGDRTGKGQRSTRRGDGNDDGGSDGGSDDDDDDDLSLGVNWSLRSADERAAYARLCDEQAMVLAALDDAFYRLRSHALSHAPGPGVFVVPAHAVRALTPSGVVQLAQTIGLHSVRDAQSRRASSSSSSSASGDANDGDAASLCFALTDEARRSPVTKLSDDARAWVHAHYRRQVQRLASATAVGAAVAASAQTAAPRAAVLRGQYEM